MKKFKVFVDIDEEEKYLNEMANKGYILKKRSAFGRYHFVEDKPQDLHYKVDYRDFNKKDDFEDYVALFEDAGWKHVFGSRSSVCQYFLPYSKECNNEIFSDIESKAGRYLRLKKAMISWIICFVLSIISIMISINFNLSELGFLTPGLWNKHGNQFFTALFFELPFVLLRIVPVIILFIFTAIYTLWTIKAKKLYDKAINKNENL